jgi:hypothetical protein
LPAKRPGVPRKRVNDRTNDLVQTYHQFFTYVARDKVTLLGPQEPLICFNNRSRSQQLSLDRTGRDVAASQSHKVHETMNVSGEWQVYWRLVCIKEAAVRVPNLQNSCRMSGSFAR